MNTYKTVKLEGQDHVGIITLNRPEAWNMFNVQLGEDLVAGLNDMQEDQQIRVVVIKGAGSVFCAGVDVREILDLRTDAVRGMDLARKTCADIGDTIVNRINKPVIASVHGFAIANGCGLVATCDLAVASESAHFGVNAIDVGLFCTGPGQALARSVPRKKVLEMLYTGKIIDAQEALRIGLVNEVVPDDKLEEATMKLAGILASKSPLALQLGKHSFYKGIDMSYSSAIEYMAYTSAVMSVFEDAEEGMRAFLEKRKPQWRLK